MTKYFNENDSIEGNEIQLLSRKILHKGLHKDGEIGLCVKYKCERDAYAKIIKSLLSTDNPISQQSYLQVGDELCGKDIITFFCGCKPIKVLKRGGVSGTHSSGELNTKSRSYACIITPFKHIQDAIKKRDLLSSHNKAISQNNNN